MDDLLLQKYLRNETSEEELAEVLDWLDASTENQRYLDRLDYISNLNILAGEAQPRVSRRTVSLWKRTAQWSAAAAAALLVCAGVSHYLADRILEYRTRDMMAITAPNGQSMSVTLSDGTTVWLNSGAKLEYPSIFSRKTRRVKISGEAMFEVKHDASRPFIVETFACDAEVLGTKFNILADARTADFSAALLEGRLKILNRLGGGESFILSPNEQIDLVDGHHTIARFVAFIYDFFYVAFSNHVMILFVFYAFCVCVVAAACSCSCSSSGVIAAFCFFMDSYNCCARPSLP